MKATTVEIGAAYIRVSTDDQTELSPDAQLRTIMDSAKQDGFVIPQEFIFEEERGISGRKAENRPAFQRMIATAKSQSPAPFSRLYVWKFSRFARNQEESTFYKGILRKKCGVEVKSVSEPIAEGMFGRLIETIIEWFDEYYSYNLSGEVIRGMTEKALRHGYQLVPPIGYKAVGGGKPYVIDEDAYKIVEFIFQSYYSGMNMTAISRACNANQWKTPRGNPFERRTIERILQNKFYTGEVEWNGYNFHGDHEVRTSITNIFDDVQKMIRNNYRPIGRRDVTSCRHWLSGLLVCGYCGATLAFSRSTDLSRRPHAFVCWKKEKGYHSEPCTITVKKAERLVLQSIESVLSSASVEYDYIPKAPTKTLSAQQLLVEAINKVAVKEQRIREAYEAGIDTLEEYKENKQRLATEKTQLIQELEALKSEDNTEAPSKDEVLKRIRNAYELITDPNINYEIKGDALRRVVKKIVYDKANGQLKVFYYT